MGAPVKNTCPDIDKVIKEIRAALKAARDGKRMPDISDDAHRHFDDIETALWGLEDKTEELRSANNSLREWGIELENQLETAANQINDLENRLEEAVQRI